MTIGQRFLGVMGAVLVAFAAMQIPAPAIAQGAFAPVYEIDGLAITRFEVDERVRMLRALRSPGNLENQAEENLIEERLMKLAINRAGIKAADEEVAAEIDAIAGRANQDAETFLAQLGEAGVSRQGLQDFARVRVEWRQFVRSRFLAQVSISEEEIDRAIAQSGGGIRALLSEIVLPATPDQREDLLALAERLSRTLNGREAFERAALRYSSASTRADRGRMGWLNLSELPPSVSDQLLAMSPGDISGPIENPNAIFVFYLRDLQEIRAPRPTYGAIDYMLLRLPGAGSDATNARLASIRASADRCSDIWGFGRGLPENAVRQETLPPAQIPARIRAELDLLDENEISTRLTSPDGSEAWVLMLCARSAAIDIERSREEISRQLRTQRLVQLADSYLAELRAAAKIIEY